MVRLSLLAGGILWLQHRCRMAWGDVAVKAMATESVRVHFPENSLDMVQYSIKPNNSNSKSRRSRPLASLSLTKSSSRMLQAGISSPKMSLLKSAPTSPSKKKHLYLHLFRPRHTCHRTPSANWDTWLQQGDFSDSLCHFLGSDSKQKAESSERVMYGKSSDAKIKLDGPGSRTGSARPLEEVSQPCKWLYIDRTKLQSNF